MKHENHQEIDKFNKIAQLWWEKNHGPFKILHQINPLRAQFIKNCSFKVFDLDCGDLKILDIGCGGGILTESLQEIFKNGKIYGLDAGAQNISAAKKHASKNNLMHNIEYIHSSFETFVKENYIISEGNSLKSQNLWTKDDSELRGEEGGESNEFKGENQRNYNFCEGEDSVKNQSTKKAYDSKSTEKKAEFSKNELLPESFDIICAIEIIEHVDDFLEFLFLANKILKPGGLFFISTINRNFKSYLLAIIAAEYILNFVPKNTHEWSKFLKPSEIILYLIENFDYSLLKMNGMKFNLFKNEWFLNENPDVNYILCMQKPAS